MGCWTPIEQSGCLSGWRAKKIVADGSEFTVTFNGKEEGRVKWALIGDFNIDNALMAIAAARHAGVPSHIAIEALAEFINTKRRLELRGIVNDIKVYDDFAHHPTAIAKTLAGVRSQVDTKDMQGRVIAVLEPRSNTMKSGVHKDTLPTSLHQADHVFIYQGEQVKWSVTDLIAKCHQPCLVGDNIDQLVVDITEYIKAGDSIVVMSNGSFSSIHEKLLNSIEKKYSKAN